jgi:hypothetical protein
MNHPGTALTDLRLDAINHRLDSLQRSNHRLRLICGCLAVVLVVSWLFVSRPASAVPQAKGQPVADVSSLVIRDKGGKVRASLGCEGDRGVSLKLFDRGKLRTEYRVWDNGVPAMICYYDDNGEAISIGGGGSIDPSLDLFDHKNLARVQLSLGNGNKGDSSPNLSLHHEGVRTRFQLGIHSSGIPYMDFFDQKDKLLPVLDKSGVPISTKK